MNDNEQTAIERFKVTVRGLTEDPTAWYEDKLSSAFFAIKDEKFDAALEFLEEFKRGPTATETTGPGRRILRTRSDFEYMARGL